MIEYLKKVFYPIVAIFVVLIAIVLLVLMIPIEICRELVYEIRLKREQRKREVNNGKPE